MAATGQGRPMGHEFLGVIEEAGSRVSGLSTGDLVITPFTWCDNTCEFCRKGLQTSCRHGGRYGFNGDGGQGEAVRVPQAQGTLVKLPVAEGSPLLTLSDVLCTGHHGAVKAGVSRGDTVTVIGDGAVGLFAVPAARRLGAERIILMGGHTDRTDLGRDFGATDIAERGDEGVAKVRELTGGDGTGKVIECVGTRQALETAFCAVTDGGAVSRLGVPSTRRTGGACPARAYVEDLMPDILDGTIEPGRVFDRTVSLDQVPDGYRAMANREALKILIRN
jgi:threonine dehydrogenase-like Zn-dependent dehydrogenase